MASASSNPWLAATGDGKSRSFKDVLAGNSSVNGGKIDFVHGSFKGFPALMIDDNDISRLAAPFVFTLVGKFVGRRPNLDTIRKFFLNLKLTGTFSVGLMDPRHVAIQLANDLDYSRIFARRTYYILGCQMRLLKWTPDFDVSKESPIAPVWISFPNLRLHFFNQQILFALASIFGRPLQSDQATAAVSRPSVARVLVEMDISKKHPKEVWIGSEMNGYQQKVVLENYPVFCGFCKMHGHANSDCFKLHPNLRKMRENQVSGQGEGNTDQDLVQGSKPELVLNVGEQSVELADVTGDPVGDVQKPEISFNEPIDVMLDEHNNRPNSSQLIQPDQVSLLNNALDTNVSISLVQNGVQNLEEGELDQGELVVDLVKEISNLGNETVKVTNVSVANLALNDNNISVDNNANSKGDDENDFQQYLIWNVRGIGCANTRTRLKNLCRIYSISMLIINEPFIASDKLLSTARFLHFKYSMANVSNKIWVLWNDPLVIDNVGDFNQVLHCSISLNQYHFFASFVYAASNCSTRKILWDQLTQFANNTTAPWMVGGDFNTISNPSERVGGSSPNIQSMEDFNSVILDCNLIDIGFSGSTFTWNRGKLWQRLDRALFNESWINLFQSTHVEHLNRTMSDHSPLLITIKPKIENFSGNFRFQNMWLLDNSFTELVQLNWLAPLHPNDSSTGMDRLWHKLKRLKQKLNWWNHNIFKNIFSNIVLAEEKSGHGLRQGDPSSPALFIIAMEFFSRGMNKLYEYSPRHYFRTLGGIPVSHLCFADDVMIFSNGAINRLRVLMRFINNFGKYSGLAVNNNKSCFIASSNLNHNRIIKIIQLTGFKRDALPLKYLGVQLFKGRKRSFLFDDLISAISKKLLSWDSSFLSFGGRLTLIKSVLCSLPVFSFQTLKPTFSVCNRIEKLINKFFWRGMAVNSKILWSSWSNCCGVQSEGGLGCKSMMDLSMAFDYKLWFHFRANKSLWSKFMNQKYCGGKHPSLGFSKPKDSKVWKRLCNIKWSAEPHVKWGLGRAQIFFWQDQWLGSTSVDSMLNTISNANTKVEFFLTGNEWNQRKLFDTLPYNVAQDILKLPLDLETDDVIICDFAQNGNFNIMDAWHEFRVKNNVNKFFNVIWHKSIPKTIAVFMWRLWNKFIPTDDILKKKGFTITSKCQCCYHVENLHHVFISGPLAVKVWLHFDDILHLNMLNANMSIRALIDIWFINSKGHIRNVTASLIFWYLWWARNNSIYNNTRMNYVQIINMIKEKVHNLFAVNLLQLKNFLNCYDAVLYFGIRHNGNFSNGNQRLVYWHKPPVSIFKLNVDGSVRNDGFGCGGIIRDEKGNLVVAFAEPLPTCSVVKAELFAILKGIKLCFSRDIYNIWIEVDAISTIHFLMQNSSNVVKHDLFYLIREIKHLLNMANCNMSHVYREGNACADWLANFGCNLSCFTEFSNDNLPLPVKGMIRLDKLNMPYLRK
ncbi:hypothetical protein M5K25_020266 [Dendrobium thyrsiflorum]|uniref:Uncharacterized protein n=1 Tax=Dendrobium thyrsiflorum TaxID=117978 RepID=A0ABD0UGH1_DENTH